MNQPIPEERTCPTCGGVVYEDGKYTSGIFCSDTCKYAYAEDVENYLKAQEIERERYTELEQELYAQNQAAQDDYNYSKQQDPWFRMAKRIMYDR